MSADGGIFNNLGAEAAAELINWIGLMTVTPSDIGKARIAGFSLLPSTVGLIFGWRWDCGGRSD